MLDAGANLEIWMMVDWIGIKTRLKIFFFVVLFFQNLGLNYRYGRVESKLCVKGPDPSQPTQLKGTVPRDDYFCSRS
jgi:hypothetical protein